MKRLTAQHEAISASAGSGKTFQLAHRYIRLLANGVSPDRISALTFSRKAAGEIFDSVVAYLREACASQAGAEKMARRIGKRAADRRAFLRLLRKFVEHLHRIHIGTLDSFIIGVVRSFPAELGIAVDFQVTDDDGSAARDIRQEVLAKLFNPRPVDRKAQREFIEAFKQATFGKEEKGMEHALDTFIGKHRKHHQILPDGSAWGNVEAIWPEGVKWRVEEGDAQKDARKLESLLAKKQLHAGLKRSLLKIVRFAGAYGGSARWDESLDRNKAFAELLAHMSGSESGEATITYSGRDYSFTPAQSRLLHRLLCSVIATEIERSLQQTAGIHRVLDRYAALYDTMIRETGRLTFSDAQFLLTTANAYSGGALLSRAVGKEGRLYIDYRLDCKLDHWLLDEFQDTSDLQWAVLNNLADEILQDDSGQRSFFYVGDVKQAVYAWRGGNARLFNTVLEQYKGHIRERPLSTSFRSCRTVIDVVNRIFGTLRPGPLHEQTVAEWNRVWQEHSCQEGEVPSTGCVALLEPKHLGDMEKPTQEDRHRIVARLLQEIDPLGKGLTVGILVRSNAEGKRIVDVLRRECPDTPITHEGRASIRDNPVVEVLLSLVKFAAHPGDTFAWCHLAMSPLRACLAELRLSRAGLSLVLLREINEHGFRELLRHWGARLDKAGRLDSFGRRRLADLLTAAGEFDAGGSRNCDELLRFVDSYEIHELATENSIRVMTVHQSKGLGFDIVILPELMGRSMERAGQIDFVLGRAGKSGGPRWALKMPRRIIAEHDPVLSREIATCDANVSFDELCVLYVAVTRSKRALYLITSYPGKLSRAATPAAFLKQRLTGAVDPEARDLVTIAGEECLCLYESGNRGWYRNAKGDEPPPAQAKKDRIPEDYRKRPSARKRFMMVRPSAGELSIRSAAGLFAREMRDVLSFGSAIHALFEQVEWIDNADVDTIVGEWLRTSQDTEEVKRDVCDQFRKATASKKIRQALTRPEGHVDLWREKRFEVVLDSGKAPQWVTGVFDRVTILSDNAGRPCAASVLDYKSDRISKESELKNAVGRYREQMLLYGQALSRILSLHLAKISLQLLFTRAAEVRPVPRRI